MRRGGGENDTVPLNMVASSRLKNVDVHMCVSSRPHAHAPTLRPPFSLSLNKYSYTFLVEDGFRRGDPKLPKMHTLLQGYKEQKVRVHWSC